MTAVVCASFGEQLRCRNRKKERLAHREGRTRSLQIIIEVMARMCTRYKSLTLYPIELGGQLGMNPIGVTRGYYAHPGGQIPGSSRSIA